MTEEIKVLIIEDEEMWSKSLAATLYDFGYTISGIADNFESAVTLLNTAIYDIALVDINLNNKNSGIELGKMINTYYKKPFIFITASTDHTLSAAVGAKPSAYLSKPVNRTSLIATIQSAINNFSERISPSFTAQVGENDIFFVKWGAKYKKLNWANIVYMRSDKNYTTIYNSADKTDYCIRSTLSKTLNYIIPAYLRPYFVQVNRAEAVHVPFILELYGDEIRTEFRTLTVTDSFSGVLKKAMNVIM